MFSRINAGLEAVGEKITSTVGTMWAALAFAGLAFVSLPAVIVSGDPLVIVAWVAQTFLQLVLLPVIMVGQSVQAKRTEMRDQETHDAVMAEHSETQELLREMHEMLNLVSTLEATGLSDSDSMT
jgi:hypothetical protein